MSIDPFPESIEPRKFCNRNGAIHSSIPLGKLQRLCEYLHDDHGRAEVCLRFGRDDMGHCLITGTVKARVTMPCQRCLEETTVELESELAIKTADSEQEAGTMAAALADSLDRLEIVVCDKGRLDLLSLIEDELILSLPIVASHEDVACSANLNTLHEHSRQLDGQNRQAAIKGLDKLEKLKRELKKEG